MEKAIRRYLPSGGFDRVSVTRSRNMAAIRGFGNHSTEWRLRAALVRAGVSGWHLGSHLPGRPDFYLPQQGVAIFVDGCFWHGCPKCGHTPRTRSKFWKAKLARNKRRDRENMRRLASAGVTVLRFWEHDLKYHLTDCVETIQGVLRFEQVARSWFVTRRVTGGSSSRWVQILASSSAGKRTRRTGNGGELVARTCCPRSAVLPGSNAQEPQTLRNRSALLAALPWCILGNPRHHAVGNGSGQGTERLPPGPWSAYYSRLHTLPLRRLPVAPISQMKTLGRMRI